MRASTARAKIKLRRLAARDFSLTVYFRLAFSMECTFLFLSPAHYSREGKVEFAFQKCAEDSRVSYPSPPTLQERNETNETYETNSNIYFRHGINRLGRNGLLGCHAI
jgi:hypothetical protein